MQNSLDKRTRLGKQLFLQNSIVFVQRAFVYIQRQRFFHQLALGIGACLGLSGSFISLELGVFRVHQTQGTDHHRARLQYGLLSWGRGSCNGALGGRGLAVATSDRSGRLSGDLGGVGRLLVECNVSNAAQHQGRCHASQSKNRRFGFGSYAAHHSSRYRCGGRRRGPGGYAGSHWRERCIGVHYSLIRRLT